MKTIHEFCDKNNCIIIFNKKSIMKLFKEYNSDNVPVPALSMSCTYTSHI